MNRAVLIFEMDDELLIELIRLRPVIYNSAHSKYMDNKLKDNLWKEISQILKEEGKVCKNYISSEMFIIYMNISVLHSYVYNFME